jgi:hypothetical protein
VTGRAKAHSEPLAARHPPRASGSPFAFGKMCASLRSLCQEAPWTGEERKHRLRHHTAIPMTEATRPSLCGSACGDRSSGVLPNPPIGPDEERAIRKLCGVPTSWISFVKGEGSARRSIGSVSVRVSFFGGKHVRVAACADPSGRIHSLPQGVECERRQVHTPASRPMSVARRARRIRRRVQPGRTGRIGCFRENTSVSSIADFVSRCRAPSERSGEARLQCKMEEHATRVSVSQRSRKGTGALYRSKTKVW